MTAIIPNPTPSAADLALLRLGDVVPDKPSRIGQHGPAALRRPRK